MTFSFESASQNFLGITDVLYLEKYEELRNLVFISIKTVILTHKNIFRKQIPRLFQERIMGAGTALGLYNVSLQYQQHNANRANCISRSAE